MPVVSSSDSDCLEYLRLMVSSRARRARLCVDETCVGRTIVGDSARSSKRIRLTGACCSDTGDDRAVVGDGVLGCLGKCGAEDRVALSAAEVAGKVGADQICSAMRPLNQ